MARRIIIGEILNLIKSLGGNPSKFMGTKSNINFLGKGPKEAMFQGQIDIDGHPGLDLTVFVVHGPYLESLSGTNAAMSFGSCLPSFL